jgi:predicted site-specific integrase-resolvase
MKTLREFAQEHRISYRTAWNYFKAGKIPSARENELGRILIEESIGCTA